MAFHFFQANLGGEKTFILTSHVAGIVNPPTNSRYSHYVSKLDYELPDEWLENANDIKGSWWTTWASWLAENSGPKVNALNIRQNPVIEDAPGSYGKSNYRHHIRNVGKHRIFNV